MSKKNLVIISAAIIASILNVLLVGYISQNTQGIGSAINTILISAVVIYATIKLIEKMIPAPKELRLKADGKPIWQSKLFWSGFVMFLLSTFELITGEPIGTEHETIRDLVIELDWKNTGKAMLSLSVILIRYFDVQKHISSIFTNKE